MELYLAYTDNYLTLTLVVAIILVAGLIVFTFNHYVAKHIFIALLEKIFGKENRNGMIKMIMDNRLPHRIAYLIPAIFIYIFSESFNFQHNEFKLLLSNLAEVLAQIYILFGVAFIFSAILNCVNDHYNRHAVSKLKPIKSYLQLIKIFIFAITIILTVSILFDKPPIYFITGVGATTALLALVFKDMVMGFIASIQLAAYDMVRIGDWIEMPNFAADGEVMEISLNAVKVQNFDKTIVTIPSSALLTSGIKNWRGMQEAGGRRVKRSIHVDINSIKMCDDDFHKKINDLLPHPMVIECTNVGWFRQYLHAYLQQHKGVHKNMRILIRQVQGTGFAGLPLELYFFTNETDALKYEAIQSDIIEHVYAIMPRFDLRAFQSSVQ